MMRRDVIIDLCVATVVLPLSEFGRVGFFKSWPVVNGVMALLCFIGFVFLGVRACCVVRELIQSFL